MNHDLLGFLLSGSFLDDLRILDVGINFAAIGLPRLFSNLLHTVCGPVDQLGRKPNDRGTGVNGFTEPVEIAKSDAMFGTV